MIEGEWSIKPYVLSCEFCGEIDCERMEEKEDPDDTIQDLTFNPNMKNKAKRYTMYKAWIRFKYGTLGRGKGREVHEYVRMLIVNTFPPPTGTDLTGFNDE